MKKRIGLLTGGGDAPGLNGIIESCVRALSDDEYEIVGICDGFDGVYEQRTKILKPEEMRTVHAHAGTILGTSNKSSTAGREKEFLEKFNKLNLHGLIAAGGDGTFSGLQRVIKGIKLIGVPKTIDNDLAGTDFTFGYDTACAVVAEEVDDLNAKADDPRRVFVIEAMGRTAGWIALGGGLASYADGILIPERPFDKKKLIQFLKSRKAKGQRGLIIVASEGAHAVGEDVSIAFRVEGSPQAERFGGFSEKLARWIEQETGWESRHVVLGHLQRSHAPTTTDRFMTLAMGVEVANMVRQEQWGNAVVYREGRLQKAPLSDLMQPARLVDPNHRYVKLAQTLDIFI